MTHEDTTHWVRPALARTFGDPEPRLGRVILYLSIALLTAAALAAGVFWRGTGACSSSASWPTWTTGA